MYGVVVLLVTLRMMDWHKKKNISNNTVIKKNNSLRHFLLECSVITITSCFLRVKVFWLKSFSQNAGWLIQTNNNNKKYKLYTKLLVGSSPSHNSLFSWKEFDWSTRATTAVRWITWRRPSGCTCTSASSAGRTVRASSRCRRTPTTTLFLQVIWTFERRHVVGNDLQTAEQGHLEPKMYIKRSQKRKILFFKWPQTLPLLTSIIEWWQKSVQHFLLCILTWEFPLCFSPQDVSLHVMKCKLKCEDYLMPNVGGHFVPNFVANIYHHLQYSYYKCELSTEFLTTTLFLLLTARPTRKINPTTRWVCFCLVNNGRKAVPCAFSYFLFEPEDKVMGQNLQYYRAYSDQWGLEEDHFKPRKVGRNKTLFHPVQSF